jgi:signal transduction histidine kinase
MSALAWFSRSLAARLVVGALTWSLLVLLIGGLFLARQYRESVMRGLDGDLQVVLDALVARTQIGADGAVVVETLDYDPRFANPGSGRYWQIALLDTAGPLTPLARSQSLWDEQLPWPRQGARALVANQGATWFSDAAGPFEQPVRMGAQIVVIDGAPAPLTFFAATDRRGALADAQRFNTTLAAALVILAAGLIAMVLIQVLVGLAPLKRLRADVIDVRRGRKSRLDGAYPTEVAPLTSELNALLDHNRSVVERARTHVGNLAHALKTPISVLVNEARAQSGALADLVTRQTETMSRNVDHYLQRAQAAARAETVGARTDVAPVIDDITRTLQRLYGRDHDLDLQAEVAAGLVFKGERNDLEEMAGNLIENACKYGGGAVRVTARQAEDGRNLAISIEDDGPGLAPETRAQAIKRGERLDERASGQGLGLSIVADLARLYGGDLALGDSELGGLSATLTLPLTD